MHTVVDKSSDNVGFLQHREGIQSLTLGEEVGALNVFGTGKKVVELGTRPEVGSLPPLVDGDHNREP